MSPELDADKEQQEKQQISPERKQKDETIGMFMILGIVGLAVGYYCNTERIPELKLASTIGTAIFLLLISGLIALIFKKAGKWRLAFFITFCILSGSMVFSKVYEQSKQPKQPTERRSQFR